MLVYIIEPSLSDLRRNSLNKLFNKKNNNPSQYVANGTFVCHYEHTPQFQITSSFPELSKKFDADKLTAIETISRD